MIIFHDSFLNLGHHVSFCLLVHVFLLETIIVTISKTRFYDTENEW